jgi:hypothetical protein
LQEFKQALVHAILAYNTSVRQDYKLTAAMRRDGVKPVPCEIWAWGLQNQPKLREMDSRKVRLGLLPVFEGTVLQDGISIGGLRYTCAKARMEQWFDSQKAKSNTWKVKCSYDPGMVDHVFLWGTTIDDLQVCDLTQAVEQYAGYTWAEVDACLSLERKKRRALEEEKYQNQVDAQFAIQNIQSRAAQRAKKNGRPNTTQLAAMQDREQTIEAQTEAQKTFALLGAAPLPVQPTTQPVIEESNSANEWAQALAERNQKKQYE